MQEILEIVQQYGTEISLLVAIVFSAYQMYSPKALPATKAQKLVSKVLELLERLSDENQSSDTDNQNGG